MNDLLSNIHKSLMKNCVSPSINNPPIGITILLFLQENLNNSSMFSQQSQIPPINKEGSPMKAEATRTIQKLLLIFYIHNQLGVLYITHSKYFCEYYELLNQEHILPLNK